MSIEMIAQNTLLEILEYNEKSGSLFWKERGLHLFEDGPWNPAHRKAASWNRKNSGKEALTSLNTAGYRHGFIFGKHAIAHRIIWKMITGETPLFIDHIDGDRLNNRMGNLREVTKAENGRNTALKANSTSGVCGVGWYKRKSLWVAKICVAGKDIHLGYFENLVDAASARSAAEKKYGFHENHGKRRGLA